MKPYPAYKDSGVEWLGQIPSHWERPMLRMVVVSASNGTTATQQDYETDFPVSRIETISSGKINKDKVGYLNETNADPRYLLDEGDVLFSHINSLEYVGNTAQIEQGMVLYHGMNLLRLRPQPFINHQFFSFAIKEYHFRSQVRANAKHAINQVSIGTGTVKSIPLTLPPLPEQKAIAKFLDDKTQKLDRVITIKEKQIEHLKELRTAIINQAVTKGLDPHAPMKDSGIEWLGEIPEHWEVKKTKFLFEIVKRIAGELGHEVLSITQQGIKIKDTVSGEGQLSMDYSKYQLVEIGDFAMNHMDLLTGFVDISQFNGVTSPDYRVFRILDDWNDSRFFLYIFQLCYRQKIYYGLGQGSSNFGRWRLPRENFVDFYLPSPPQKEQRQIAVYLETKIMAIDQSIQASQKQIDQLKEYRTALISEVVTGKIDVREAAP